MSNSSAQIEFSTFEKCFPGKRIRNCLFCLPKSSFGRGKSQHAVIISMCLSNSQHEDMSLRCVCRTHKPTCYHHFEVVVELTACCHHFDVCRTRMACRCIFRNLRLGAMELDRWSIRHIGVLLYGCLYPHVVIFTYKST